MSSAYSHLQQNDKRPCWSPPITRAYHKGAAAAEPQWDVCSRPKQLQQVLYLQDALHSGCQCTQTLMCALSMITNHCNCLSGVTCCETAGDDLSNYCTSPQSVAQVYLPGKLWPTSQRGMQKMQFCQLALQHSVFCFPDMNMSGSLPDVFASFPDLQSVILTDNQVSCLPDTSAVASEARFACCTTVDHLGVDVV